MGYVREGELARALESWLSCVRAYALCKERECTDWQGMSCEGLSVHPWPAVVHPPWWACMHQRRAQRLLGGREVNQRDQVRTSSLGIHFPRTSSTC